MDNSKEEQGKNRRTARRRPAKGSVQVICYANALGLGANIALKVLDVSEAGVQLKVKSPLTLNQEVEVNLSGIGHRRPVKLLGNVVWIVPVEDSTYRVGLRFQRYMTFQDLQELGQRDA